MWFSASIFMKPEPAASGCGDLHWQETVVLIEADDEEEARVLAEQAGKSAECQYDTVEGKLLWKFVQIERICRIEAEVLGTGTEVFCRFLRPSEAASLLTPFD